MQELCDDFALRTGLKVCTVTLHRALKRAVCVRQSHIELAQPENDAYVHEQMRGHMDTFEIGREDVASAAKRSWRRHSAEFKARVIEMARQPGTSVAAVALANGLNANMLRRWVHEEVAAGGTSKTAATDVAPALASFVQLSMRGPEPHAVLDAQPVPPKMPVTALQQPADIALEIHRGGTTVHAKLPMDDRSAAWLREVLG